MDRPVMADRRAEPRTAPPAGTDIAATLRPGYAVLLVNVSARGALVQAPRPLRPGARIHLQVVVGSRRVMVGAWVQRCAVSSLQAGTGVLYRGALTFEERVHWQWV